MHVDSCSDQKSQASIFMPGTSSRRNAHVFAVVSSYACTCVHTEVGEASLVILKQDILGLEITMKEAVSMNVLDLSFGPEYRRLPMCVSACLRVCAYLCMCMHVCTPAYRLQELPNVTSRCLVVDAPHNDLLPTGTR